EKPEIIQIITYNAVNNAFLLIVPVGVDLSNSVLNNLNTLTEFLNFNNYIRFYPNGNLNGTFKNVTYQMDAFESDEGFKAWVFIVILATFFAL
ncbi:1147_t:CDS:2, partial [Acaulospora colombiana]